MPHTRSRVLHAEFFTDAKLADAEFASGLPLRVAYAGLWCVADREGRFEWKPRELKLLVLPYDAHDMAEVLETLAGDGFVVRYEVDGAEYGWIPRFKKWQKVHPREAQSQLPAPPTLAPSNPPKATRRQDTPRKGSPKASLGHAIPGASASTSASTSTSTSVGAAGAAATERFDARPFLDAFREVRKGIPPAGVVAKACKAVVTEVGTAQALHRWNRFLVERPHSPPMYFMQEHGQYAGPALVNGRPPPEQEPEPNWIEATSDPDEIARLKSHGFR